MRPSAPLRGAPVEPSPPSAESARPDPGVRLWVQDEGKSSHTGMVQGHGPEYPVGQVPGVRMAVSAALWCSCTASIPAR